MKKPCVWLEIWDKVIKWVGFMKYLEFWVKFIKWIEFTKCLEFWVKNLNFCLAVIASEQSERGNPKKRVKFVNFAPKIWAKKCFWCVKVSIFARFDKVKAWQTIKFRLLPKFVILSVSEVSLWIFLLRLAPCNPLGRLFAKAQNDKKGAKAQKQSV